MNKRVILSLLMLPLLAVAELPEGIQPDYHKYFASKKFLLRGGSATFDDCVIAVGTAANNPENGNIMRSLALADANSNLISTVYGVLLKAREQAKDEFKQINDKVTASNQIKAVYSAVIENRSLNQSQICGEWVSPDKKTYFVAVARFFKQSDIPRSAKTPAAMPNFLRNFQAYGNWHNALLCVRGIMRGGAALYYDEYGEEYLITVGSAPTDLPYSQRLQMMRIKAGTEAAGYVNGNMINDERYLEESFSNTQNGDKTSNQSTLDHKHIQTSIRQGAIRNLEPAGSWDIADTPQRTYQAFVLRLSDVATESFPIIPAGADENSDTIEIDTVDDSGKQLAQALENAQFYEKDDEVAVVVPDDSPIFDKDENEIELADPLQKAPEGKVQLQAAGKINAVERTLIVPQVNIAPQVNVVNQVNVTNETAPAVPVIIRRSYVPVRYYRRGKSHVPKRLIIHRARHFHKKHYHHRHHPGKYHKKMHHPPKFRIRTPRPGHKFPKFRHRSGHSIRRHAPPPSRHGIRTKIRKKR